MMYIPLINPLINIRYFTTDPSVNEKSKAVVIPGLGFWRLPLILRPAQEIMTDVLSRVVDELSGGELMESRVLYALARSPMSSDTLEHAVYRRSSLEPNCTLPTALKRLEKKCLISKKLVSRGYIRRYVYRLTDA